MLRFQGLSKAQKHLLASHAQGRRLKAGVAKDLGGVYPEARDVAVLHSQVPRECGGIPHPVT